MQSKRRMNLQLRTKVSKPTIYTCVHSLEWLNKYFEANCRKKSYDRFNWWRSYAPKKKPLHPRYPFRDKLLNGDYDMSWYQLEAELVEHKLNDEWAAWGHKEPGRFNSECSVDMARRKRLLEDFDKEESKRLDALRTEFVREFKMTKDQYDDEVLSTDADSLIDFYYEMKAKYGTKSLRPQPSVSLDYKYLF